MAESDVVSRLLAAIEHEERMAPVGLRPDAVLRLCQAHRDIVAEWQRNKQIADQLQHEAPQGDAYLVAKGIVAGLWAAVTLVARGYGVEDGEDR